MSREPITVHVDGEPVTLGWHGQTTTAELQIRSGIPMPEVHKRDVWRVLDNDIELVPSGKVKCSDGDEFISGSKAATAA